MRSDSPAETRRAAADLAESLAAGDVVHLVGPLGAGKTTFVRGLADALGAGDDVSSPTFELVHVYTGGRLPLVHADLHRLGGERMEDDVADLGLDSLAADGILAIEWPDRAGRWAPAPDVVVRFAHAGGDARRIVIERIDR